MQVFRVFYCMCEIVDHWNVSFVCVWKKESRFKLKQRAGITSYTVGNTHFGKNILSQKIINCQKPALYTCACQSKVGSGGFCNWQVYVELSITACKSPLVNVLQNLGYNLALQSQRKQGLTQFY